jgi:hypothetical protein
MHTPDEHTSSAAQAAPQPPQFWGSLAMITQLSPHAT